MNAPREVALGALDALAACLAPTLTGWADAPALDRESAFTLLVARHKQDVFRIALSVLGPALAGEAEDVAQEVFVRLYRASGSLRGGGKLTTWLYRVAFNLAADRRRLCRHRREHLGLESLELAEAPGESPLERASRAERARRLVALLDELPDAMRSVLYFHYWMEESVEEIARRLAVPEGTVKSHLHRGRKKLESRLTSQGGVR